MLLVLQQAQKEERVFKHHTISKDNNIVSIIDCIAALVGRHMGFIVYLKEAVLNMLCTYSIPHQQHLVAIQNAKEILIG